MGQRQVVMLKLQSELFGSVYVGKDTTNIPEFPTRCSVRIDSLSLTKDDLFQKLSTLVPLVQIIYTTAWILKEGRQGLCKSLAECYSIFR